MFGCEPSGTGEYTRWLAKHNGQVPHELDYPYLFNHPKLTCPANVKIFNADAKVVEGIRDYHCDETKLKQLVTINLFSNQRVWNYLEKIKTGYKDCFRSQK